MNGTNPNPRRDCEGILYQLKAETEIKKATENLTRCRKAIETVEVRNPNDERLGRARTALDYYEAKLSGWRCAFLEAWWADYRPN